MLQAGGPQAPDGSELKGAAASVLGVPLMERQAEYEYLLGRAMRNGVSDGAQMQGWIVDQLNVMKTTLQGSSTGSRMTDLIMYLKAIDKLQDNKSRVK